MKNLIPLLFLLLLCGCQVTEDNSPKWTATIWQECTKTYIDDLSEEDKKLEELKELSHQFGDMEEIAQMEVIFASYLYSYHILEKVDHSKLWSEDPNQISEKIRKIISVEKLDEHTYSVSIKALQDDLARELLEVLVRYYVQSPSQVRHMNGHRELIAESTCERKILKIEKL